MTCVSPAAPSDTSGGPSLLHALLKLWARRREANEASHRLAALDDRALRDLGLSRDAVAPPAPRDPAGLWLNRVSG